VGSLRVRLLAAVALVAGAAVLVVALVSRQGARHEFFELERSTRGLDVSVAAEAVRSSWRGGARAPALDSLLASLPRRRDQAFVVSDSAGRLLAASSPDVKRFRIEFGPGERIDITGSVRQGNVVRAHRAFVLGAPHVRVPGADGGAGVTVWSVPLVDLKGEIPPDPFLTGINRWMLGAVIAAAAMALLLTWFLSKGIAGPIEALTKAARRMERGDLKARVETRSRDEVGALAGAFNAMAASLERTEALRRQMVTDVAHELRTPLTNLRGQLEAVEDGILPADSKTIASLREEAVLLSRLVDDLQEIASAEAGRLRLDRERVSVREALEGAAAAFRAEAGARRIALIVDEDGAEAVDADRARLGQVLRNLVANAVAHTPEGGRVTLRARREDHRVAISASDTGPGIPAEHLPHVFERFYRADAARSRATGGAGLGLAIVKHLVEAHGGEVSIESRPGEGTTVTCRLPAAAG
jgi:signal transduction histidine kinase